MVKWKRTIGLMWLGLTVAVALAGCGQSGPSGSAGEPSGSTIVTAPAGGQPSGEGAGKGVM